VANKFKELHKKNGKDSVAYYGSGQALSEESYLANRIFKVDPATGAVSNFVTHGLFRALQENRKYKLLPVLLNEAEIRQLMLFMEHMNYPIQGYSLLQNLQQVLHMLSQFLEQSKDSFHQV
jgi:hypothetical protein